MATSGDRGTASPPNEKSPPLGLGGFWQFQYFLTNSDLPSLTIFIFLACSIAHLIVSLITKTYYMLPLAFGCILEITGQVIKILCLRSSSASQVLNFYVVYSLITDLVPCFFLASIGAMILRITELCPRRSLPSATRRALYWTILLETAAFSLQAYGLLVRANPILTNYRGGRLSTIVGCGIESLNLILVWTSLLVILGRCRKTRLSQTRNSSGPKVLGFAISVAISVFFVSIRSVLRLSFYLTTTQIDPFENELQVFLFESLPIAAAAVFLALFHPCRIDEGLSDSDSSFFYPCTPAMNMKSVLPSNSQKLHHDVGSPVNRATSNDDSRSFCTVTLTPRPTAPELPFPHLQASPCEETRTHIRAKDGRLPYHRSFSSAYQPGTMILRQDGGGLSGQASELGGKSLWLEKEKAGPSQFDANETYNSGIRRRQSAIHFESLQSAWSSPQNTLNVVTPDKDNEDVFSDGFSIYSEYLRSSNIFALATSEVLPRTKDFTASARDYHDDQDSVYSVEEDLTPK